LPVNGGGKLLRETGWLQLTWRKTIEQSKKSVCEITDFFDFGT
jgi:hypothetical protein